MGGGGAVDERYVMLGGGVPSSVKSITRGSGGVKFSGKKRYMNSLMY